MENKESYKELTKTILLLAAVGIIVPALVIAPGLGYAIKPFLKKKYQPSRIQRTLERLKNRELISIAYDGSQTTIQLSEKGKKRVLSYELESIQLKKGRWDGKWRIVIFDIPEKKKKARDFLRFKLKDLGFYILQKSVLVTPWECRDIVDFVKHYYDVADHVSLVLCNKFDGEEEVKNYFDLS